MFRLFSNWITLSILSSGICLSCTFAIPENNSLTDYSSTNYSGGYCQTDLSIQIDTISIDSNADDVISSMTGNFFIKGDKLYFADRILSSISEYDTLGTRKGTVIRKGNGPGEIANLFEVAVQEDNEHLLVLDSSFGFLVIDDKYSPLCFTRFNTNQSDRSYAQQQNSPDPNLIDMYEVSYDNRGLQFSNGTAFFPITAEHPSYNRFGAGCRHYYKNAFNLCGMDIQSGETRMMCTFPLRYGRESLPNFSDINFFVSGNELLYCFNADSLIYRLDINDGHLKDCFGVEGKSITNDNYPIRSSFNAADRHWREDRNKFGYYKYIYADDEYLFRSYYPGGNADRDILQIYVSDKCAGEFEVPKDFRILGKINGKYYASSEPDVRKELFFIYKFDLSHSSISILPD